MIEHRSYIHSLIKQLRKKIRLEWDLIYFYSCLSCLNNFDGH